MGTLHENPWLKIDTSGGEDACHLWTGALHIEGFGMLRRPMVAGKRSWVMAHRRAWELKGRKMWQSWAIGLMQQFLWLWLIVDKAMWGLLILSVYKITRHVMFLYQWKQETNS